MSREVVVLRTRILRRELKDSKCVVNERRRQVEDVRPRIIPRSDQRGKDR